MDNLTKTILKDFRKKFLKRWSKLDNFTDSGFFLEVQESILDSIQKVREDTIEEIKYSLEILHYPKGTEDYGTHFENGFDRAVAEILISLSKDSHSGKEEGK